MRILIVDDSKVARIGVKRSLPEHMTQINNIEFATNGLEAVEKYKEERFDLVFMDLTMPVKDGYEATKEICEYDKKAYIIVVTADIQNSGMEKVLSIGAKDVIKKPIDTNKLNHVLVDFFHNRDK
jgi:CheY-like chemotaxis protein